MNRLLYYFQYSFAGTVVWCILFEDLSLKNIVLGFILSIFAVLLADAFLSLYSKKPYSVNPIKILYFLVLLVYKIYSSGIKVIVNIITGKTHTGVVRIKTKLKSDNAITLLANAITLTPGTVTIEKQGQNLIVLCIEKSDKEAITGKMEEALMGRNDYD